MTIYFDISSMILSYRKKLHVNILESLKTFKYDKLTLNIHTNKNLFFWSPKSSDFFFVITTER